MREQGSGTGGGPRGRGRSRRWVLRALALLLAVGVVALAGGFSPQPPSSPGLRLTSGLTDPNPPTNVVVTGSDRALAISWTAANEQFVSGYRVYLDGTLKASPTGTSTTVTGLVNGHGYVVTVHTATSFVGGSYVGTVPSTAVTGTPRDAVPPAAPTGVSAARGDSAVTVSWTADSADYDADGYRVLRNGTAVSGLVSGRSTTSWTDTGLVNDTTYGYTVQAHDTSGNWSASSSPVVSATPTDLTAPMVPSGLTATRGDKQVRLSWTANPDPDLASYRVLRDGVEVATVAAGTTTHLDTGRTNDTTYSYALAAVDTHGNRSATSAPAVPATPTDLTPPAAPTGLTAVRGDGRVTLSWSPNPEPDLASYRVLRGGVEIATVAGTAGWVDTGVVNDSTYSYTLTAVDTHGNRSAASAAVTATPTDLTAPAAPTGLTGGRGDGRAGLSWSAGTEPDLASYRVLRDGVEVATVPAGTTTFLDPGLTNDRTYAYTLVAVDTHGNRSPASGAVSVTPTDLTPPAAPGGLAAVRGDGSVSLSWTANTEPDLASYRVLRGGVEVATVTAATAYLDPGLTDDVTYTYSLVAVDSHGNRSISSAAVSATPTDLGAPAAPTGLAAVRGDGQVDLTWSPNTEPDLASYRVLRDGAEVATVTTGPGWTDTGLTADRTYTYTLVAVDTHGNRSPVSAAVSATPTDLTAPAAPTGLVATRGDGRVTLSWTANAEPDLASYRVLRGGAEVATVTGSTGYVDGGLGNDTTYAYALVAVDTHGNRSTPSSPVSATPTDLTPPAPPSGVTAIRGENQVALSWTANPEPDLASYRVLRDGMEIATATAGTSYLDGGLTNDTAYSYTLVAVDTHGNRSAPSAVATATPTDLTPPAVPAGLAATAGDGQVSLTWAAGTEPDLASYRVLRDGVEIATLTGATGYLDTGAANGTTWTYTVLAVDTHGNRSAASAPVRVTPVDVTPPGVPTGLTATPGDGQVTLAWTANPEPDLATYRVSRDGVEVATVTGATTWTGTGLTDDTAYRWTLVAVDTSGNRSAACAPVWATPVEATPPSVPTGLVAGAGDGRVSLSWTANPEPDLASYRVLRDGVEIATVTGSTGHLDTGHLDTGVVNGTTYTYALVAVDTHGNRSAASPGVTATPADLTAPGAPAGLTATRGDRQVTLAWTANPEPDLASYRVLRDGVEVGTAAGTTTWTDTGLTDDVTYTYALVAVDRSGNRSAASSPAAATPTDLTPPAAPTGLTATRGDGRITLAWAANPEPDLASYRVLRDGTEVASVTAGTVWVDAGVVNGTTYTYALVAVDTHGNRSAASAPVTTAPADTTPPAVPTGLTATRGDGQVTLAWTAGSEPDLASYRVLRDGVEAATVTGATGWTDTGRVNDTTYSYALVAVDTRGNRSAASSPAVEATPTDLTPPAAPAGVGATAGDGSVSVTWAANTEPDLASYTVLRNGVPLATVSTGTGYVDTGLAAGTTATYTVVAVDTHANRSAPSAPVTAGPADRTPPAPPTGVSATPMDGRVVVTWSANQEADLASYRVLRDGVEVTTVLSGTGFVDTGLTNGVTYTYTVVAVDAAGNRSAPSADVTAVPADTTAPAVPTGLTATPGDRSVALSWTANAEPDLASYRVLRDGAEVATLSGATAWTDAGLVNGTAYSYALVAVDTNGNPSAPSAPVRATPADAVAPAPPASVSTSAGNGSVTLRWTAPADADLASYRVLDGNGATVATVAAPATSATVRGLTNNTSYSFTVVAVDTSGNLSPASAVVVVTPAVGGSTVPGAGSGDSGGVASSSDGRYVVIGTRSSLEPSDTNTAYELYLVDRTLGSARRIAPLAATATGASDPTNTAAPAISDDGRYVALATTAALVPTDRNGLADVYRYDTAARTWTLVSVPAGGTVSSTTAGAVLQTGASVFATSPPVAMSADGDLVLFYSARADLVTGDTNGVVDLFAKRLSTGAVTRVSTTSTGANLSGTATGPALALTPDGRFALFPVTPPAGGTLLYRKTLSGAGTGTTVLVSTVTVAGRATTFDVYRDAGDIAMSADGRYVAVVTAAQIATATPGSTYSTGLAYRLDTATGAVLPLGSGQTTVWEHQVELDPTGRYGFFATAAGELPADANAHTDQYRRDLAGDAVGPLVLVTADAAGKATPGPPGSITSAEYGRVRALSGDLVLVTTSQGLVPADTDKLRDLYAKDLVTGSVGSALS